MTNALAPRSILAATFAFVRTQPGFVVLLIAIDAVPQMAMAFASGDWSRLGAALSLVTLYLQLLLTFRVLAHHGLTHPDQPADRPTDGRYLGAVLLNLETILAILIGLVLLVVPGILLMALWSLSMPVLAAERLPAMAAMRRSWTLTRPHLKRFVLLVLTTLAPFFVMAILAGGFVAVPSLDGPFAEAIFDLSGSIWMMLTPIFWACAYAARRGMDAALDSTPVTAPAA